MAPGLACAAADAWDAAAVDLRARVDAVVHGIDGSHDFWTGSAAEAARHGGGPISAVARLRLGV